MEQKELKCKDKVKDHFISRLNDLKDLWDGYCNGDDEKSEEFCNYGLSFDYVEPGTFEDQLEGYFRYQISYGGPSDEFRFYTNPDFSVHRIEYWFLDWFDGASITVKDDDLNFLITIFNDWKDCGTVEHVFNECCMA